MRLEAMENKEAIPVKRKNHVLLDLAIAFLLVIIVTGGYALYKMNTTSQKVNVDNTEKYKTAAFLSQTFNYVSSVKAKVGEYYLNTSEWPNSNEVIGLPEADEFPGKIFSSLTVSEGGIITIRHDGGGLVSAGIIIYTPYIIDGVLGAQWECITGNYKEAIQLYSRCSYFRALSPENRIKRDLSKKRNNNKSVAN